MEWTTYQVTIVAVVITAGVVALSGLFAWGLRRAGAHPAPAMLVVSLSLLSAAALIGGLAFDSDSALALAGAGIGALAGAVSATFTQTGSGPPCEPPKETDTPEE